MLLMCWSVGVWEVEDADEEYGNIFRKLTETDKK